MMTLAQQAGAAVEEIGGFRVEAERFRGGVEFLTSLSPLGEFLDLGLGDLLGFLLADFGDDLVANLVKSAWVRG